MNPADIRTIDDTLAGHRWRYNPQTEFYETLPAPDCGPTILDPMNVLAELPDFTDDEVTSYEAAKRLEWIRAGKPALSEFELAGENIAFKDVWIGLQELPLVRRLRVGQMREPFS